MTNNVAIFLNITPVEQTLKETINKWDFVKLKSFYKTKDMVNKTKWQPTEWVKIFTNLTSDWGLISKIYKEFKKLVIKRTNNPIKKMDYRPKQKTFKRRIYNGWKTLKEMLNILSQQRNANQNNFEIPSYTCINGQDPKHWRQLKLEKLWGKGNTRTLLVKCKLVQPLWVSVWWFLRILAYSLL